MSGWTTRRATAADAAAVVELRALMFSAMGVPGVDDPGWQAAATEWFGHELDGGRTCVVVAEDDEGQVVAGAMAGLRFETPSPVNPNGVWGLVNNVATQPRARRQGEQADGEPPQPRRKREPRRQPRDGEPRDDAADAEQGVEVAREAGLARSGREDRGAGLDRPEDRADEQLGRAQHDEGRGQEPADGAGGSRGRGVRDGSGLVQGEPRAEDGETGRGQGQGRRGTRDRDAEADERRTEDEGGLVGCALVGEGGVHEAVLARPRVGGDRAPTDTGQRADLRQKETRDRARDRGHAPRESGVDDEEDAGEPGGPGERLEGDDPALAESVGAGAPEGCPDGVGHGEGPGAETSRAVAAGGGRHEQECAELAHRERHAGQEGDDDVRAAGEAEEVTVRVDG